ncbi:MAG: CinA family nicotinamide mononucleotide deamidase-related protein [Chloroflexi bacterium]|nr:MAG: competence/damage-inducible protein A [Phototrophicales bacterium]RMF82364.1 MAG: CinA family nicotinamide mononucleotide deamidase-related protein [Chloroflexota bacterium]
MPNQIFWRVKLPDDGMIASMQNVNAEIISIGTEILLGEITDTNSVHIARKLRDIGVNLYYMTSVGDNQQRITDVIRTALSRSHIVITTGGLGPTVDDMTRQAVAAATNRRLVFHQELLDAIAERFAQFRVAMTENNRQQAYLPENAIVIKNPVGTAPSFIVEHEGRVVISLPGVPREMKFLIDEQVIPYLRRQFDLGDNIILTRILRTAGIGESSLDDLLGGDLLNRSNPTVGLAAHAGQTDIRLTAKADSETLAANMLSAIEAEVRERVGDYIFGVDDASLERALIDLIRTRGTTLAITEVGNQGALAQRLKSADSDTTYLLDASNFDTLVGLQQSTSLKRQHSMREFAEQLAFHVAQKSSASIGVAIISRHDMDEIHADAEEGTAMAVYSPERTVSRVYGFGGNTEIASVWTSTWTMAMIWRLLQELPTT